MLHIAKQISCLVERKHNLNIYITPNLAVYSISGAPLECILSGFNQQQNKINDQKAATGHVQHNVSQHGTEFEELHMSKKEANVGKAGLNRIPVETCT